MFFDIEDDECLEQLLTGTIIAAKKDTNEEGDPYLFLTYNDGRQLILVVESFGLILKDSGSC
jgi:hypothetical protein